MSNSYIVTFHRLYNGKPFFYPVDILGLSHLPEHLSLNPGTIEVRDGLSGNTIWSEGEGYVGIYKTAFVSTKQ